MHFHGVGVKRSSILVNVNILIHFFLLGGIGLTRYLIFSFFLSTPLTLLLFFLACLMLCRRFFSFIYRVVLFRNNIIFLTCAIFSPLVFSSSFITLNELLNGWRQKKTGKKAQITHRRRNARQKKKRVRTRWLFRCKITNIKTNKRFVLPLTQDNFQLKLPMAMRCFGISKLQHRTIEMDRFWVDQFPVEINRNNYSIIYCFFFFFAVCLAMGVRLKCSIRGGKKTNDEKKVF